MVLKETFLECFYFERAPLAAIKQQPVCPTKKYFAASFPESSWLTLSKTEGCKTELITKTTNAYIIKMTEKLANTVCKIIIIIIIIIIIHNRLAD